MNFLSSISSASGASSGQAQIVGGDEAALRRFLSLYVGQLGLPLGQTTVYIGRLPPEGLPADLPLPEDAQIAGSVARDQGYVELLLAVSRSPEAVASQCESLLAGAGWQTLNWPGPHQAFADQSMPMMRRLCHTAARMALTLTAGPDGAGGCVIRLTINREARPCQPPHLHPDLSGYLPTLKTPPGARMLPLGGGSGSYGYGGQRYVSSSARLVSERSAAELAAAYHEQLEALANWQPAAVQTGEQAAISAWVVTQAEGRWSGYFTLVADPLIPNEYLVSLYLHEIVE